MSEQPVENYTCAHCGGVFEKEPGDDEAANAEARKLWGVVRASEDPTMEIVCEGCFRAMDAAYPMEQARLDHDLRERERESRISRAAALVALPSIIGGRWGPPWGYRPAPVQAHRVRGRRNDPCPCGSGRKFKKCCLEKP